MRYKSSVSTFAAGELSPDLRSRTDLKQYNTGLKLCENFVISENGSAYRRQSSIIQKRLGDSRARRIHVVKTDEIDVVIIFQEPDALSSNLNWYMNNIKIWYRDTDTISDVKTVGSQTFLVDIIGAPAGATFDLDNLRIIQIGVETWVVDSTGVTPPFKLVLFDFITGPEYIYECPMLDFQQTILNNTPDDMRDVIKANPISGISGEGFFPEGSLYFDVAIGAGHGVLLANPVSVDLRITSGEFGDEAGQMFYVNSASAREAVFLCIAVVNSTTLSGMLLTSNNDAVAIGNAQEVWKRSSFGNFHGYPQTIGLYQGRGHLGTTKTEPLNVWVSDLYDLDKYMNTRLIQDTGGSDVSLIERHEDLPEYAFTLGISTSGLAKVTSLGVNAEFLFVGTTVGDHQISYANTDNIQGYARDTAFASRRSDHASANSMPVYADSKLLYLAADSQSVRTINVLSDADRYENINISVLSNIMYKHSYNEHKGFHIEEGAYLDKTKTVWFRTSANGLMCLSIDDNTGVTAWSRHQLVGKTGDNLEIVSISDNLSIDTGTGGSVYLLVTDGVEDVIVSFSPDRHLTSPLSVAHLDLVRLGTVGTVGSTSTVTVNDDYYDNQLVDIVVAIAQGGAPITYKYFENLTINGSSQVVLPEEVPDASNVTVGKKYKSKLHSLVISEGNEAGTARGDVQRIDRLTISLYNALGGVFGQDDTDLNEIEYPTEELYTGDVTLDMSQDSSRQTGFIIETDSPYPMTVTSVTSRGVS